MNKYFNVTTIVAVVAGMYALAIVSALVPSLSPGGVAAKLVPAKTS
jgi:hypothetical protein